MIFLYWGNPFIPLAILAVEGVEEEHPPEGWGNCGRAVSLLAPDRVDLKPLITHSFPLIQIEEGFKTFREKIGEAVKVVVKPNDLSA